MPFISHTRHVFGALFLVLVGVLAALFWSVRADYHTQLDFQRQMARHSVGDAAEALADLIETQRDGITYLAQGKGELLSRLADNPADREARQALRSLLEYRFPSHVAHTLATPAGELLNDLGEDIAEPCREELRQFAANTRPNLPYVHPTPGSYHYELMAPWRHGTREGILLVAFNLDPLARLLKNNQVAGHRLVLARQDLPHLIEADAAGGRDRLGGDFNLSGEDLARSRQVGARAPIPGTLWELVDIPEAGSLAAARRHLWFQFASLAVIALALGGLLAWVVRGDLRRREREEQEQIRLRGELEDTVQKRTGELRASEARANLIIDTSPDAIIVAGRDGRMLRVNAQAEALFGYTPEEMLGQAVEMLLPEPLRQDHVELRRAYFSQPGDRDTPYMVSGGEMAGLRKDGGEFPIEAALSPILFDQEQAVILTLRDITERRRAESALRDERDFVNAVVEAAGNVVVVLDREGRIVRFNRAAERITGYRFEDLREQPIWALLIPPEHRAEARAVFDQLMQDRLAGAQENEWVMRDGSRRLFAWRNTVLRDARGEVTHVVALGYDITDERASEAVILRDREQQRALRELLEIVLHAGAMEETLSRFLDRLLRVSWLSLLPRGGVFLMDKDGHALGLCVSRNLDPGVLKQCTRLPLGRCLCGQAAASGRLQFADHVDARHEVVYPGMPDHGHYCVPLKLGGEVLGVLVLYLPPAFRRDPVREEFIASVTDILASYLGRMREEASLRESEASIRVVMDSLYSAVVVLDADGVIVRVNESWRQFARDNGGDARTIEGVGLNYLAACAPAMLAGEPEAQAASEGIRAVLSGQLPEFSVEYPCHAPQRERWFILRAAPLQGMQGTGVVLNHTDISERKRAEAVLTQQQQRLEEMVEARTAELEVAEERTRLILQSSADGLFELDQAGRFRFANAAVCDMLGYPLEVLIGQRAHPLIHHSRADGGPYPDAECPMHRALHERRLFRAENEVFWRRDGRAVPVEYAATPMFKDGRAIGVVVSVRDVTERKRMEDALRRSEANLSHAQALAHVGSWHLDIAGDVLTWSEETYRMFGEPRGAPMDLSRFMAHIHPDDVERVTLAWAEALEGRPYDIEHRILANGAVKWVREQAELRFDAAGKLLVAIGAVQDISEIKQAEQATRQALEAARQLARAKSEFLANMSHEIRTPLNAVLGLARIGARDSGGREAERTFRRILDAGGHLLGVINDILDVSKLEAGKISLERRPFQLRTLIDDAGGLIADAARQKGLVFETSLADLPEWVNGDLQRLRQILVNLLSNAVKFTERGEVRLRVAREGNDIYFKVADTGIGMNAEQLARLFRPFEQADGSTTRKYGGTGLGLAISRDLAGMMGGDISVESALGAGSAFCLRVPLPEAEPHLPSPPAPAGGARLKGLRILAAEDVEVNRLILEDLLVSEGALPALVENGRQALERLEEAGVSAFDAVLMDVQMPEMDGHEATRRINVMAPGLPVIGLTAHALAEERDKCLAAGMVEHVTKPIDADLLVEAILRHVRRPIWSAGEDRAGGRKAALPAAGDTAPCGARVDWPKLEARFGGKRDFIDRLAKTALSSQADTPGRLRAAAAAGDGAAIAFLAHSLKGVGGNLMAEALRALAAQTETSAKSGDPGRDALAEHLAVAVQELLADLNARLEKATHPPTEVRDE